jgi:hypothetical protein
MKLHLDLYGEVGLLFLNMLLKISSLRPCIAKIYNNIIFRRRKKISRKVKPRQF